MAANGRHRRYQPSRINRASLTVTVGGVGIALPLITAASAGAASAEVWEKVAACESTSNWHVNTGNGYYGGLQFTRSTWAAYGGTAFASRADLATKDQQIAIAEKVLGGQGPGAWPSCSVSAGLTRGGDAPDIAPQTQRSEAVGAVKAAPKSAGETTAPRVRPQSGQASASPTAVPGKRDSYTVASGDSLSGIAADEHLRGGWQGLYEANRTVVGKDPDLILPGQRLSLAEAERTRRTAPKENEAPQRSAAQQTKPGAAAPKQTTKPAPKQSAKPEPKQTAKQQPKKQEPSKQQPKKAESKKSDRSSSERTEKRPGFTAPVSARTGTPYHQAGSWSSGYHTGVDFPVPTGTSVKAVGPGKVVSAGWAGAYGYEVVIRHSDGKYSQYAHLSALHVRAGQQVGSGQRIARSGTTGNSTGPHLHFEVRTGPGYGSDVDPLAYLRAGGVNV